MLLLLASVDLSFFFIKQRSAKLSLCCLCRAPQMSLRQRSSQRRCVHVDNIDMYIRKNKVSQSSHSDSFGYGNGMFVFSLFIYVRSHCGQNTNQWMGRHIITTQRPNSPHGRNQMTLSLLQRYKRLKLDL